MIDINYSLRIAYTNVLQPLVTSGTPVYYMSAPPKPGNNYIVMYGIQSVDASTHNSSDTRTQISFALHGFDDIINSGLSIDIVARDFYNLVYPNVNASLTIDGAQILDVELLQDIEQPAVIVGGRNYKQRNITLAHNIYHRSDVS